MKTRIIAAVVLVPLLLVFLFALPTWCTAALVGVMAAIAAYELLWRTGLVTQPRLVIYSALMALLTVLWGHLGMDYTAALLGILLFTAVLYTEELLSHAKLDYRRIALCYMAGVLIPFLLGALVRILGFEHGRHLIVTPFVLAFLSDTGAYFAGRFFGKHKLAPIISPNKTVEGVIGGVLLTMLGMALYGLILQLAFDFEIRYIFALLYGLLGALAAVFGDLSFSAIKRQTGIKDYGNLIPGHGGILDRFDSMSVVAPLAEALLLIIPFAVK